MLRDYKPLAARLLQAGSGYAQPTQVLPERISVDDAAQQVMTDFRSITAIIILSGDSVDEAHRRMLQRGVRLLLVVDQDRHVVGVITARDILGEKPLQIITQRGLRREELLVRDIMTSLERLEVLDYAEVRVAKVGHIVSTLQGLSRQHAVVVERDAAGKQTVRGVFSATQIARQLGIAIVSSEIAHTFSEIETQLAR